MTGRGKLSRTARSRKFGPFRSASRWAERLLSGVVAVRGLVHLCQRFARRSQVVIGVYRSSAANDARKLLGGLPTKHEGRWHPATPTDFSHRRTIGTTSLETSTLVRPRGLSRVVRAAVPGRVVTTSAIPCNVRRRMRSPPAPADPA